MIPLNLTTLGALLAGATMMARNKQRVYDTFTMHPEHGRHLHAGVSVGAAVGAVTALAVAGWLLSNQMRRREDHHSSTVAEWIDVEVPVSTAYNQWTQFEEFPRFMGHVEEIKQIDDTHLHWRARVGGKMKEWDSEITEQIPDKRIAWRSTSGVPNAGVVTFHKVSDNRTRIMLQMDYQPESLGEKVGNVFGGVRQSMRGDLKRFRKLIEERGVETGAWRGTVQQGAVTH